MKINSLYADSELTLSNTLLLSLFRALEVNEIGECGMSAQGTGSVIYYKGDIVSQSWD